MLQLSMSKTSYIIQAVSTILLLYHNSYSLQPLPAWSPYFHYFWNCTDCIYLHYSSVFMKCLLSEFQAYFLLPDIFIFFYLHFSIFFLFHIW